MTLTVSDVLELEIFQRGEAEVLAGHDHLDRVVRWVHMGEISDIARFLVGGELLLTAGLGTGDTPAEQRAYIESLADAGVAVLVIELCGRAFGQMPPTIIETAAERGLPLVALHKEIPFVQATGQIHERFSNERVRELQEAEEVSEAFTTLLLDGADYMVMMAELAKRTGLSVVLENSAHQVVSYTGQTETGNAAISDWSAHSRRVHVQAASGGEVTASSADDAFCLRQPVILRGEVWGHIHLLITAEPLWPGTVHTLNRAAAAIAVTLLGERALGARSAMRQAALINRLMLGDLSGQAFVSRALSLGQDLRAQPLVALAATVNAGSASEDVRTLTECLAHLGLNAIVSENRDYALAIVGLGRNSDDAKLITGLRAAGLVGGVSRIVQAPHLLPAVQQADHALRAARLAPDSSITRFDDLGLLRLLVALAEGPELSRYVEDEIGPLLEHDASATSKLLPTLRAFLDSDGRKALAAKDLHIQRRTLYYRLDRIGALLGVSVDEPETRQRLMMAVRGLELLQQPPGGRA